MKNAFYSVTVVLSVFLFMTCGTENKPIYNFTGTATPEEGGTINPTFGQYEEGKSLEVRAIPTDGWEFVRWEGDLTQSNNPTKIIINKEYNVVGFFERIDYPLTITIEGEGTVEERIISSPKKTDYPFETIVQLTSKPNDGWFFYGWSGDAEGTDNPLTLTIDSDKSVTAKFIELQLAINAGDNQSATVRTAVDTPPSVLVTDTSGNPIAGNEVTFAVVSGGGTVDPTSAVTTDEKGVAAVTNWTLGTTAGANTLTASSGTLTAVTFTATGTAVLATLTTASISDITATSAQSGGEISDDGGAVVTARGVVWSTTQNPTVEANDGFTEDGNGTGAFTSDINGLTPETTYKARAYATNSEGTVYGFEVEFTTTVGRDNTTTVVEVTSSTGRIWMDRNLGASRVATSLTDTLAYGDLYQWGRAADGHQKRNSATTSTRSSNDQPGHGEFIILGSSRPYDWRSPQNDNLWQGMNGVNNPCPTGYRIPTEAEWRAERASWSSNNRSGAYASPLKLPVTGSRSSSNGSLSNVGSVGVYWSGSVSGSNAWFLSFSSSNAGMSILNRANGFSVRCIKD